MKAVRVYVIVLFSLVAFVFVGAGITNIHEVIGDFAGHRRGLAVCELIGSFLLWGLAYLIVRVGIFISKKFFG